MNKIPVFIVDDQNLFRQSLALLISSVEEFNLLGDFESGNSFVDKIPYIVNNQPHVAIIDMDMPGMNGIELNEILHEQFPQIKVIILSVHINPSLIAQMIHAKASAYLEKNCDKEELIMAIQSVYKTGFYFNKSVLKAIQDNANKKNAVQQTIANLPVKLTNREKQVLEYICKEYSNAEIAQSMYLSSRTIEGHRINLLTKTGCRNTAGLVLFAIKYGFYVIPV
ncbi:response regulator transcription factor [Mucilaginibacter sp. dw_454]|uniref:response regulator transcription factor n=1 Tax=Mucilaginibacter sp. dw_454 TaxID=2720079 RepID=UPI001BD56914|nr:response regulator transcription factor [Mucilaginibacter sp. dw_454]